MKTELIEKAYAIARERYAEIGVDTEKALAALQNISLSLHCWQADDVTGFENRGGDLTGGIQATGNYPGKARNIEELRADILKAKSFIPGGGPCRSHGAGQHHGAGACRGRGLFARRNAALHRPLDRNENISTEKIKLSSL